MDHLNLKLEPGIKICVFGDCHEHLEQFNNLVDKIKPSEKMILVSVGDYFDKGAGTKAAEEIIRKIKDLHNNGAAYTILGNHDTKRIRQSKKLSPELEWLSKQPYALSFVFSNNTRATIVHGGVKPSHTWEDLRNNNSDLLYIRTIDEKGEYIKLEWFVENGIKATRAMKPGKVWHEYYLGQFGYILSGHDAIKDGIPRFYSYSCNLDTGVYSTGILTAQVFSEKGREELIQIKGKALRKNY